MNIITGEKIQNSCDTILGTQEDFAYNPNLKMDERCIDIDKVYVPIKNGYKTFAYTHLLQNLNRLVSALFHFKNNFILLLHNSDYNFTATDLELFKYLPNLKAIYTQNMGVIDTRVKPIPIGIANSMWNHGNLQIWNQVLNKKISKNNFIFFNFNVSTNPAVRQLCFDIISRKNIPFLSTEVDQMNYLQNLASYKFAICPIGNGLDTHRFWECLYLHVVPICCKNVLTNYFSQYFPVVLLESWNDLDVSILRYGNYEWNECRNRLDFIKFVKSIH